MIIRWKLNLEFVQNVSPYKQHDTYILPFDNYA